MYIPIDRAIQGEHTGTKIEHWCLAWLEIYPYKQCKCVFRNFLRSVRAKIPNFTPKTREEIFDEYIKLYIIRKPISYTIQMCSYFNDIMRIGAVM